MGKPLGEQCLLEYVNDDEDACLPACAPTSTTTVPTLSWSKVLQNTAIRGSLSTEGKVLLQLAPWSRSKAIGRQEGRSRRTCITSYPGKQRSDLEEWFDEGPLLVKVLW